MSDSSLTFQEVEILLNIAEKNVFATAHIGQIPSYEVREHWRLRNDVIEQRIEDQNAAMKGTIAKGSRDV